MCVVESGRPYWLTAYVMCVLPIRSPIVTTMRFHPIIVPKPKNRATATLTQTGM